MPGDLSFCQRWKSAFGITQSCMSYPLLKSQGSYAKALLLHERALRGALNQSSFNMGPMTEEERHRPSLAHLIFFIQIARVSQQKFQAIEPACNDIA